MGVTLREHARVGTFSCSGLIWHFGWTLNPQQLINRLFVAALCAHACVCVALFPVLPRYHSLPGRRSYQGIAASWREHRALWLREAQFSSLPPPLLQTHKATHAHADSWPAAVNQGSCVMGKHTSVVWLRSMTRPCYINHQDGGRPRVWFQLFGSVCSALKSWLSLTSYTLRFVSCWTTMICDEYHSRF